MLLEFVSVPVAFWSALRSAPLVLLVFEDVPFLCFLVRLCFVVVVVLWSVLEELDVDGDVVLVD